MTGLKLLRGKWDDARGNAQMVRPCGRLLKKKGLIGLELETTGGGNGFPRWLGNVREMEILGEVE